MNVPQSADPYILRDLLAITTIFVLGLLGIGTIVHEFRGSIKVLLDKLKNQKV